MTVLNRAFSFLGFADRPTSSPPSTLSLALQGGGSFGAFTWGVLDRLLENPVVRFDAISGASAGAVNAVVLASGMLEGGREGARSRLASFWRRISLAGGLIPKPPPLGFELMLWALSPYQFNPFNLNPLRKALVQEVDFERLRASRDIQLLFAATRVRDGRMRIFRTHEASVDAVLASACLPALHQAIEIDGEAYWDGGYSANPPLLPLVQATRANHLLIVQVTPNTTSRLPTTSREIAARVEQIQFNATLNAELEALKLGKLTGSGQKLRRLRIGRICADEELENLGAESAGNVGWAFLGRLQEAGRAAASLWLQQGIPRSRA